MPMPLPHVNWTPSINLVKSDLANSRQYSDAVGYVTSRIICPFGFNQFALNAVIEARYSLRVSGDLDARKKVTKDLLEAETQLTLAASKYDDAMAAVRESFKR